MEEAETRVSQLTRSKTLLQSQVEELKKQLDEEVKVCVLNIKQKHILFVCFVGLFNRVSYTNLVFKTFLLL